MSKRRTPPRLSAGEMEILQMLWEQGPVTLSEAQARLGREIGYTTIQTRLNRLADKKLATRSGDRPARYTAAIEPAEVSAGHLDLLVERTGGGSVVPLVAHLVRDWTLSPQEIADLKQLIAEAERESKSKPKQRGKS